MTADSDVAVQSLIDPSGGPVIMGIVNVTPDSFSDGGQHLVVDRAVEAAIEMQKNGAGIIDVGGESTRPGAGEVSEQEELDRVIPVIESLRERVELPVSIDTSKPGVMREAVNSGAGLINDVRALQSPGAAEAAVDLGVPVCLMHMRGSPESMQRDPQYVDVVTEVIRFLRDRIAALEAEGLPPERVIVDPGFGFGKTVEHNYALFDRLPEIRQTGRPVLVGVSRKSMIGAVTGRPADQRDVASAVLAALAVQRGANIVRVHNVAATADALSVLSAVERANTKKEQ